MTKVVLDTNIFVSSIFWDKGNPHKIIEMALDKKIHVFTSLKILQELEKVLKRDFEEPYDFIQRQINLILEYATVVDSNVNLDVVKNDPDDNKIVECAVACEVDYIITGDKHLLDITNYGRIKIVKPSNFIEIMQRCK